MKIAQDLERVGDEASTIARRSILLMCLPNLNTSTDITEMTFLVNAMLKDALDAFVTGNTVLARGVIPRDKKVDDLNKLYQEDLIDIMKLSSDNISQCLHLGVIIKSLERIGDHAKNIAEDAVLLHEGKDIRHNSTDN